MNRDVLRPGILFTFLHAFTFQIKRSNRHPGVRVISRKSDRLRSRHSTWLVSRGMGWVLTRPREVFALEDQLLISWDRGVERRGRGPNSSPVHVARCWLEGKYYSIKKQFILTSRGTDLETPSIYEWKK